MNRRRLKRLLIDRGLNVGVPSGETEACPRFSSLLLKVDCSTVSPLHLSSFTCRPDHRRCLLNSMTPDQNQIHAGTWTGGLQVVLRLLPLWPLSLSAEQSLQILHQKIEILSSFYRKDFWEFLSKSWCHKMCDFWILILKIYDFVKFEIYLLYVENLYISYNCKFMS